mgnify:CR=1 FL=1
MYILKNKKQDVTFRILEIITDFYVRNGNKELAKQITDSGLCLEEFVEEIRTVLDLKRNAPLSQAAFEVLAIIAVMIALCLYIPYFYIEDLCKF